MAHPYWHLPQCSGRSPTLPYPLGRYLKVARNRTHGNEITRLSGNGKTLITSGPKNGGLTANRISFRNFDVNIKTGRFQFGYDWYHLFLAFCMVSNVPRTRWWLTCIIRTVSAPDCRKAFIYDMLLSATSEKSVGYNMFVNTGISF